MKKNIPDNHWVFKSVTAAALIIFFALIFFYPVIFEGMSFYPFDSLFIYPPWMYLKSCFRPHNILILDAINDFYPSALFQKSCWTEGIFPLWNNFSLGGMIASTHTYMSPIILPVLCLLPVSYAHDLLLFMHLAAAGLFTYLYLRQIGLENTASLCGAVAWMFNGFVMAWFEFEHIPFMAALLPASLFCIEKHIRSNSMLSRLTLAAIIGLLFGISFAHVLYYQLTFTGVYIMFRVLYIEKENLRKKIFRPMFKKFLSFCAAFIIAFIISASFFTLHFSHYQERQRASFSFSKIYDKTGQLCPKSLLTMIYPDFYGMPRINMSFIPTSAPGKNPYNNYHELCIYCGIAVLLLAACSLFRLREKSYTFFYFLTAITVLAMAMGSLLYYPFTLLPGLNISTPTRILYIFGFAVAMLSALGADALLKNNFHKRIFPFLCIWIIAVFALAVALAMQTAPGVNFFLNSTSFAGKENLFEKLSFFYSFKSPVILLPIAILFISTLLITGIIYVKKESSRKLLMIICALLIFYDLISFGWSYNSVTPRSWEYPLMPSFELLQKDISKFRVAPFGYFMLNTFIPFGIEEIGGYYPVYSKRYAEYIHLSQNPEVPRPDSFGNSLWFKKFDSPLIDLINTKYVLEPLNRRFPETDKMELVYQGEIKIYRNRSVFPRIFFVPSYLFCPGRDEAYKALGSFSRMDFQKKVILEDMPSSEFKLLSGERENDFYKQRIEIKSYRSNEIIFSSHTDKDGFVVVADNYADGWRVSVDGKEEKILRANYIMRTVPVKAGSHEIRMYFRPLLILTGIWISICGWAILLVSICALAVYGLVLRAKR